MSDAARSRPAPPCARRAPLLPPSAHTDSTHTSPHVKGRVLRASRLARAGTVKASFGEATHRGATSSRFAPVRARMTCSATRWDAKSASSTSLPRGETRAVEAFAQPQGAAPRVRWAACIVQWRFGGQSASIFRTQPDAPAGLRSLRSVAARRCMDTERSAVLNARCCCRWLRAGPLLLFNNNNNYRSPIGYTCPAHPLGTLSWLLSTHRAPPATFAENHHLHTHGVSLPARVGSHPHPRLMLSGGVPPAPPLVTSSTNGEPSSGEGSSVPQPPPKMRPKPQRRWGIGPGKRYADEAAFTADLEKWDDEHAERELLVKAYDRAMDQARDRSSRKPRKCASGAAKRAASKAEAQRGAQRRYVSRVKDAATKALAREGLGSRFDAEKQLLGDLFVVRGQRVRILKTKACGTVVTRATLCDEHGNLLLVQDEAGRVVPSEPRHHHALQLDQSASDEPELLSPYDVEPWPRIGQLVQWLPDVPSELATVISYRGVPKDKLAPSHYTLTRTLYASKDQVQRMDGGRFKLQVGSWVRLLEPHEDACFSPSHLIDKWTASHLIARSYVTEFTGFRTSYDVRMLMDMKPDPKPSLPEGWTGLHVHEAVKAATKALSASEANVAQLEVAIAEASAALSAAEAQCSAARAAAEADAKDKGIDYEPWQRNAANIELERIHGIDVVRLASARAFSKKDDLEKQLTSAQIRLRHDRHTLGSVNTSAEYYEAEQSILPIQDVFVIRAMCSSCECVELEHTWHSIHTEFEPLGKKRPSPIDHEYKCAHIGH